MNVNSPMFKDCSKPSSNDRRPKEYTPNGYSTFKTPKNCFKKQLEKIVEETMISTPSSEEKA
jgi:hypothetical protein